MFGSMSGILECANPGKLYVKTGRNCWDYAENGAVETGLKENGIRPKKSINYLKKDESCLFYDRLG